MEQTFKELSKIITLKPDEAHHYKAQFEGTHEQHLQKFLIAFTKKLTIENNTEVYSRFLNYMADQRHCRLQPDFFQDLTGAKIIACSECKPYYFESQSRAYCLYGRAVSTLRRKVKEAETERPYLCSQIENAMFQLFQDGSLSISKNDSHDIEDILYNFTCLEEGLDPIYLSSQVFSPFVPQTFALILVLPIPQPRPDLVMNFLKGTLLHVYMEQANLVNKIAFREVFYKNSTIKGIYFIEQGQVESTGGRVVARGWVTNGKCKAEGFGWKFKVLPFLKSIAKNEHIWKQFVNDLSLNKEYPFQLSYILGIQKEMELYQAPDKRGRKGVKLPRIAHRSFDYGKLIQMEKVKHYDDRINQMCEFKERLLTKKSGHGLNRNLTIVDQGHQSSKHRLLIKKDSKAHSIGRNPSTNLSSSNENILIMSVLKKLESLTQPKNYIQQDLKDKKDKIKISPAKLYQKSRVMKKKRYNQ